MAQCNKMVGRNSTCFPCQVEINGKFNDEGAMHDGPCMAPELQRTVDARAVWQAKQDHEASGLGQFQGKPETTAERYTENPTPVPESASERRERLMTEYQASQRLDAPLVESASERSERLATERRAVEDQAWQAVSSVLADPERYGIPPNFVEVPPEKWMEIGGGTLVRVDGKDRYFVHSDLAGPTKTRPEDQPLPEVNGRTFVQEQVIEDIQRRISIGIARYGTPLQPFNGRDAYRDLYEELIDATQYIKQVMIERSELADEVRELRPMVGMSTRGNEILDRLLDHFATI